MLYIGIEQQIVDRQPVRLLNVAMRLDAYRINDGSVRQTAQLFDVVFIFVAVQLNEVDDLVPHQRRDMLRLVVYKYTDRFNLRIEMLLQPRRVQIGHMAAAVRKLQSRYSPAGLICCLNILDTSQSTEFQFHFAASLSA